MSDDIYNKRARKKKRKKAEGKSSVRNKIIFVLAALIVIVLGLFITRNKWIPELEKLNIYIGNSKNAEVDENGILNNNGQLAEGNFPIALSDSSEYQTGMIGDRLVILSDADFSVYSTDGEKLASRSHDYSNVILKTAANRALIYESSGNKLRVETSRKTLFEKTLDDKIIFARISNEGYIAVVSTSDTYSCMLTVFDMNGNAIYYRGSVDRIIEVCFNNESTGCRITVMDANIGQIVSRAYQVNFTSEDEKWTTNEFETLCVDLYTTSADGLFILGDTKCAYYDKNGTFLKGYSYKNTLISGGFMNDRAAMIFKNAKRRKTSLVLVNGMESAPIEKIIEGNLKYLVAESELAYVMTDNEIIAYDYDGNVVSKASISDIYHSFLKSGNTIFLIGNTRIDKINFISTQ